ncbi:MAG: hypothetical protein LUC88_06125 [Prevotella sp.]|nr:hypothetical protein [Prevotella sp.]
MIPNALEYFTVPFTPVKPPLDSSTAMQHSSGAAMGEEIRMVKLFK